METNQPERQTAMERLTEIGQNLTSIDHYRQNWKSFAFGCLVAVGIYHAPKLQQHVFDTDNMNTPAEKNPSTESKGKSTWELLEVEHSEVETSPLPIE